MDIIKELREALDWSQSDLADKLNVSRQCIAYWEKGERAPSARSCLLIMRLAKSHKLTISLEELMV